MIVPAAYAEPLPGGGLACGLCPMHCRFDAERYGVCGTRFVQDGMLVTDNYGEVVALALDPIEKKPLYHFYPGANILSIGPNGCNLRCLHCQNWTISQERTRTQYVSPTDLVATALEYDSIGVAFTYAEPVIWFEYIRDCAPLLRAAGQKVVLVTNGYINPAPLDELLPLVDAMNIDLKGIRDEFYRTVCKGRLEPVQATIRRAVERGVHVEVTNLVIPTLNDSEEEIRDLVEFVASVSPDIPLHFSAYHPEHRMDAPRTSVATLLRAREIALGRLCHVFIGNVSLPGMSDSICRECGSVLVRRAGYRTEVLLAGRQCASCGASTRIVR